MCIFRGGCCAYGKVIDNWEDIKNKNLDKNEKMEDNSSTEFSENKNMKEDLK